MNQHDFELERGIQALLSGAADEADRLAVLRRVVEDKDALEALAQSLRVRRASRQAFGCEAQARVEQSLRNFMGALPTMGVKGKTNRQPASRGLAPRRFARGSWLARIAAVAVIAASVYVAVVVHRTTSFAERKLAELPSAALPEFTQNDLSDYRRILSQVSDQGPTSKPWVLLSNGGGEFGYVSAPPAGGEQMIVLRYLILSPEGKLLKEANILLPARCKVSLRDVAELDGVPLECEVSSTSQSAGVALTVRKNVEPTGISGSVQVGNGPTEIGQFKLGGRNVRVVLQAAGLGVS
jgi:hypothetical protein